MDPRLLPALVLVALTFSVRAQNSCAEALPIAAGLHTLSAVEGDGPPLPICATGGPGATAGAWFSYTAPSDVTLTISSDLPQNGNADTRVHLYSGDCGDLVCVGGDDDSGSGLSSLAIVNVAQGTSILIAWDDRYTPAGFDFMLGEQPWDPSAITFTNQQIAVSGSAYALVDMQNDGYDDVVSVTQNNIRVHHQQSDASFLMVDYPTTPAAYLPSWSMAAGDIDANGYLDLLYAGGSGATFMYANDDGTGFTQHTSPVYIFCQRSNMVDINNDGDLDVFICHDVEPNVYFLNDGSGGLLPTQGGLGDTPDGGNYGSIWTDYDNDHDIDLFIAKCRGGQQVPASVDQLHRNNGDGTFTEVAQSAGLADFQQSWSGAWGDYDNDGDMDVMIGASSFSQGGHKLMRNNNDGTFTNVSVGSGLDLFNGTGTEWVAHDFDNDGWVDILGAAGTIHRNNGDMTFTPQAVNATSGPIGDANHDGFLDVLNGGTLRMNTPNGNNWIRVDLAGMVSNRNGIGARVRIDTPAGSQIRDVKSGDGFRYMSFLGAHFGLGQDSQVDQVTVYWPSGVVDVLAAPSINTAVTITESLPTGLAAQAEGTLHLGPNPTTGFMTISGDLPSGSLTVLIGDLAGRQVLRTSLRNGVLDVSALAPGQYLMRLGPHGVWGQARFVKQ